MPVNAPVSEEPVFDIMYQCRAMRWLKSDPVPEELLLQLVDAALQGPSGSNAQNWSFVIVRDDTLKRQIQIEWKRAWRFYMAFAPKAELRSHEDAAGRERTVRAADYLVQHLHEVPAFIFVATKKDEPFERAMFSPATFKAMISHLGWGGALRFLSKAGSTTAMAAGSTSYPAVQNLLLAARALGLGAVLTTQHFFVPGAFERIVNLPKSAQLAGIIPVGYPKGKFGPLTRPPAESVVSWDRCG